MLHKADKNKRRKKRHLRVRNRISGTPDCPRLNVFRSLSNIYAQVIDDTCGKTLVSASTLDADVKAEAAYGGNKDAAFLAGYNIKQIMHMVYAICGGLTALGSLAMLARIGTAQSGNGTGYETDAILCVVVGGTTLKGGKGSVLRTMFGVALITLLGNCMNMLGLSTYMQTVMRGAVLVVAIWLDNRKEL